MDTSKTTKRAAGSLSAGTERSLRIDCKDLSGGRHYQTSQLKAFDKLPMETRVSAAKRVRDSHIDPTTLAAINQMERSCKRQKIAQQSNPSREESVESSPTPSPETPFDQPQSQDQINTNAAPATGPAVDENYHFSRAAPQAIANLVPSTLNYAIRRDTTADCQTAVVTMGFPRDPVKMQYCITTIDIIQKKVEYYALKLYGIEIETEGEKRYAVLAGVRIDPEHSMTFRRCRTACIKELFGKQIDEAIDTCPFRLAEYESGRLIETECVTMTINSDAKGGALISLYMGLRGGTEIRDSLYPNLQR
ncbi:uncharacterized protein PG998_014517 [Apiospora kogelbergensis]|uniref:uncharacterized protein n=1 Tax=Apiospora kogelbergensis TaxID=1337665 RepID=UPI003131E02E